MSSGAGSGDFYVLGDAEKERLRKKVLPMIVELIE